ncbi:hypothetical protein C1G86_1124 [Dehalococcoides mccartyi]|uniref:Uncharacterized protein n=1 Tax=Dehalococcoides mccartyi TaxID=61435 RepID=A0A328ENM7_9CHLR|nr:MULTISPECIES: hypothetical protein [Dehalococcoides]AGG06695.1 hypothetical protein dcmb_1095 [Dehalococcoides mccartyi DCMB5]RAL70250.1 hypothetical protein C1G86_1124 [Dehalococcoides mccartyi]BAS32106.1 hypothetical protein IBK_1063 [Dehalococcoides mccartyi IBARAKI]BEL01166.1 hypothetical protein DMOBY_10190 [Dehalococcoides mccartyi]
MPKPVSSQTDTIKETPPLKRLFPVETEYARCVKALNQANLLAVLPQSRKPGIIGIDGQEYPLPSLEQVLDLFEINHELISMKIPQGFNRLALTPISMPMSLLINRLETSIIKHAAQKEIYQTRLSDSDPFIPVRVNSQKHVWVWETLLQALDTDELVYFPEKYSNNHRGQTKQEAVTNKSICALPGWSVGLVENIPVIPNTGQGKILAGRKQLETGLSPREYLQILHTQPYRGETGKTLEDFITKFLVHLETTGEVSHDIADINAMWCLGQYLKISYAEVVPAGRWHRSIGRLRLDAHRTGNKLCTWNCGGSSEVRLASR